jgi:hypothetical protein
MEVEQRMRRCLSASGNPTQPENKETLRSIVTNPMIRPVWANNTQCVMLLSTTSTKARRFQSARRMKRKSLQDGIQHHYNTNADND